MTIIDLPLPTVEPEAPTKTLINIAPLAAALIREQGFWKGKITGEGGYCTMNSLAKVGGWGGMSDIANRAPEVGRAVARSIGLSFDDDSLIAADIAVYHWNDAPERTAEEVISLLDSLTIMVEV